MVHIHQQWLQNSNSKLKLYIATYCSRGTQGKKKEKKRKGEKIFIQESAKGRNLQKLSIDSFPSSEAKQC